MNKKIEELYFVGFEQNKDYEVVSDTPFDYDLIVKVYHIVGHNDIDLELAKILNLGVIKLKEESKETIYFYSVETDENATMKDVQMREMLRLGIYYQLKNPSYVDIKLETISKDKQFKQYLFEELLGDKTQVSSIVNRLNNVFESQKGNENNVVPFIKKGEK